jgi:hypothetical protein
VREVDQHADPVHLPDDVLAELVQPAEHRLVGGRVRPGHVVVVGQRHVPHAEHPHHPQHAERLTDRVAALHPHQRCDPAGLDRRVHIVGRRGQLEIRREPLDESPDEVELLESTSYRALVLRHPQGPELRAHVTRTQPGQVRVELRHRTGEVVRVQVVPAQLVERDRQVVVPVDHRMLRQQRLDPTLTSHCVIFASSGPWSEGNPGSGTMGG